MPGQQHPFDQSDYQVRLEWGVEGSRGSRPADVVVVVDVLRFSSTVIRCRSSAASECRSTPTRAPCRSTAPPSPQRLRHPLRGAARRPAQRRAPSRRRSSPSRSGAARARASRSSRAGELRLAGAVAAALRRRGPPRRRRGRSPRSADLGIDHSSPEAAAAGESFRGLRARDAAPAHGERLGSRARSSDARRRGRTPRRRAAMPAIASCPRPARRRLRARSDAHTPRSAARAAPQPHGVIAARRVAGVISRRRPGEHVAARRSAARTWRTRSAASTRRCRYATCPAGHTPIHGASSFAVSPRCVVPPT